VCFIHPVTAVALASAPFGGLAITTFVTANHSGWLDEDQLHTAHGAAAQVEAASRQRSVLSRTYPVCVWGGELHGSIKHLGEQCEQVGSAVNAYRHGWKACTCHVGF
jgi:hypothetical protein